MIPRRNLERLADLYGGILILGSLPDSPAACAGLKYGDVLTRVNGVPVEDVADFFRARALDREHMRLEFIREGLHMELTLELNQQRHVTMADVQECLGGELGEKDSNSTLFS